MNGRQAGGFTLFPRSIWRGLVVICAGALITGCDQTTGPGSGQDPLAKTARRPRRGSAYCTLLALA